MGAKAGGTIFALALMLGILTPPQALADDDPPEGPPSPYDCEAWQQEVEARLSSSDPLERELGALYDEPDMRFCKLERTRVARFDQEWDPIDFDLPALGFLSNTIRVLIIAVLLGLCLWLLWRWRHVLAGPGNTKQPSSADPVPPALSSRAPEPKALPEDIPAAAAAAWAAGDARGAMSLLYRGAVAALLPARSGRQAWTEREVITEIGSGRHHRERQAFMRRLVGAWQRTAWAHRPPETNAFEALRGEWNRHCGGGA